MFSKVLTNTEKDMAIYRPGATVLLHNQMTYCTAVLLGRRNGEDNQYYILVNLPSYCHLIFQAAVMETVSLLVIFLYITASSVYIWSSNITILFSSR